MNDENKRHHNGRPRTRAQERIDALGTAGRPARAMPDARRAPDARRPDVRDVADGRSDARGVPDSRAHSDGEELRRRLEELEQELGEARAAWQRTAADFANYKRRTEQEREASLGLANESLLRKLLAVVDDFDRALGAMPAELEQQAWAEGIRLVERKLRSLLESEGVTPIEAAGKPFDPREHEAVVHQETAEAPDETVIDELQKGYRIRDRVLRPALVAVAKNTNRTPDTTDNSNDGHSAATGEGH